MSIYNSKVFPSDLNNTTEIVALQDVSVVFSKHISILFLKRNL